MISYQNISLFDAPQGGIIVHACNSQGVWGSGIAKPFKEKYPYSYISYQRFVEEKVLERGTACGRGSLTNTLFDEDHVVGWIVTSHNYADKKDSPELIKIHTTMALVNLCEDIMQRYPYVDDQINVYSNKFNSGLFAVPWEQSELILKTVLKDFPKINWVVCDPEGK